MWRRRSPRRGPLPGWNSRDVDTVLSHFADDAVFASPIDEYLLLETAGVQLVSSWCPTRKGDDSRLLVACRSKVPDFHVDVLDVYADVDMVVINYRNEVGLCVSEVPTFLEGQVGDDVICGGVSDVGDLPSLSSLRARSDSGVSSLWLRGSGRC